MPSFTIDREVTTTMTVEHGEKTLSFVLPNGMAPESHEDVNVARKLDGSYVLTWLALDDASHLDNPLEGQEGYYNEGVSFVSFRRGEYPSWVEECESPDAVIDRLVEDGTSRDRLFLVECYSHGLESYSLVSDQRFYPDRQWDVGLAGVLTVPDDATEPEEYARGILEEYTSWVNGDVWGVVTVYLNPDGSFREHESCWGYVGRDYAETVAKEEAAA